MRRHATRCLVAVVLAILVLLVDAPTAKAGEQPRVGYGAWRIICI